MISTVPLPKGGDGNVPLCSDGFAVQFDALNLVQGLRSKIAFSAMRTADDRDVLNHEQASPFAITAGYLPNDRTTFTAYVTNHRSFLYSRKMVINTNFPVGLNLIATITASSASDWPPIRYFHSAEARSL